MKQWIIIGLLFVTFFLGCLYSCRGGDKEVERISKLEAQVAANSHLTTQMWVDRDKAVDLLAAQLEKRLEGMNEFRTQLKDQASTFITRDQHDTLVKRVEELQLYQANQEGRLWMLGAGLTAFFSAAQTISYYMLKKTK